MLSSYFGGGYMILEAADHGRIFTDPHTNGPVHDWNRVPRTRSNVRLSNDQKHIFSVPYRSNLAFHPSNTTFHPLPCLGFTTIGSVGRWWQVPIRMPGLPSQSQGKFLARLDLHLDSSVGWCMCFSRPTKPRASIYRFLQGQLLQA